MKIYTYRTDSEMGEIGADSLADAMERIRPWQAAIADGAWAWVQDPDTGERIYVAEENMP